MKIKLTIDNKNIEVDKGKTILEAARENGIDIPALCYHKDLDPIGACRICVVEVQKAKNLTASCCTPAEEGMVVHTNTEKVQKARKTALNLILSSHPHNCLLCASANACELQKMAADFGVGRSIYKNRRRFHQIEDISPYVLRDLSKCILCFRCVRGCKYIKKETLYAVGYRGFDSKITVGCDEALNSEKCKGCDICIRLCPVGALLKPEERFDDKTGSVLVVK